MPPPGRLSLRRELSAPIAVPSRGYVFDFQVHAAFTWTSDGLEWDLLNARSQQFMSRARRELERVAADVARNYPAHRARDLEVELNRQLTGTVWRYEWDGTTIECRSVVRVRLDDRVKEHLQPFWEKRIKMEAEHELSVRRAELVDQLSQRWLAVLEKMRANPATASAAAQLTEKEFAEVMRQLIAEQKEAMARISTLVGDAVKGQGHGDGGIGAYEFAETFDLLNESLRRDAGLSRNGGSGKQPR